MTAQQTGVRPPVVPSALDDYLFDLQGYLVLKNAVEPELLDAVNEILDNVPNIPPMGWWGNVQRTGTNEPNKGLELQNVVEAGEPFERLIDHPSWINYMYRYAAEAESCVEGLFIDECFASARTAGGYLRVHSADTGRPSAGNTATSTASSAAARSTSWWRSPTSGRAMAARC